MIKKIPHTFVIIFYLLILAAILTWIIPGGQYEEKITKVNGIQKKEMVFHYTDNVQQWWQVFSSFYKGFTRQSGIIVFILMIGGAFWIVNNSRAIDTGIFTFIDFTKRLERFRLLRIVGVNNIIIILVMLMFSLFGAVFGMSEETIAFIIILVPLSISMGYDSITGVCMVFVAAGLGFAGAMLNPFTIGIAQGIAGLPMFSGIEYRFLCWVIINIVGIVYVLWYAQRVKRNPKCSPVFEEDAYWRERDKASQEKTAYHTPVAAWTTWGILLAVMITFSVIHPVSHFKIGNAPDFRLPVLPLLSGLFLITGILALRKSVHFYILLLLAFTIIYLITGVMGYHWYIMEIATLFFAMGIFSGVAMKKSPDEIVKLFLEGVKDILPAALVVGLAGGIIVILEDGQVIDTILYNLSESMKGSGKVATVGFMYLIQNFINLILVSGSAKAALTMPIFAPFSDLVELSRQATVMAYQFGDGFTNMITPASPVLMGVLGVARIPYEKWFKWVWPFVLILILLGFLLLIPTVTMELKGF
ncbi:MAG: AbgT family transporter [Bacteroidales bacterium]|nr:AbgT family transporter [Bacteroidales bacterium]MBN2762576.1 AbgT family transporter [Bacteroidales bacterium]